MDKENVGIVTTPTPFHAPRPLSAKNSMNELKSDKIHTPVLPLRPTWSSLDKYGMSLEEKNKNKGQANREVVENERGLVSLVLSMVSLKQNMPEKASLKQNLPEKFSLPQSLPLRLQKLIIPDNNLNLPLKQHKGMSSPKAPVTFRSPISSPEKNGFKSPIGSPEKNGFKSPIGSPEKNGFKSPIGSPLKSPSRFPINSPLKSPSRFQDSMSSFVNPSDITILQQAYTRLERQYTDAVLTSRTLEHDNAQLQLEVERKDAAISEQLERSANYEAFIRTTQQEYERNKELLVKENQYYKELISELQVKAKRLAGEVQTMRNEKRYLAEELKRKEKQDGTTQKDESTSSDLQQMVQMSEKFNKLLIDFKVLQSNFELERNLRLVLIDQIELLTKENELLTTQTSSKHLINDELANIRDQLDSAGTVVDDSSDFLQLPSINHTPAMENLNNSMDYHIHTMNELTDEEEEDEEFPSDILAQAELSHESLDVASNFKFPPSPDLHQVHTKRMSLPPKLRSSPQLESDEFVLSPLKLTAHLYTHTKPSHQRYNSHDLFPIKVEFEEVRNTALDALEGKGKQRVNRTEITKKLHEAADQQSSFSKLGERPTSYSDEMLSNRNSTLSSSSKRLSVVEPLDISKEEFVKLRFELQSLKLHNEKLLLYIGFELQKQKKNIKKLSTKQSARTLRELSEVSKQIEYSDAKLIEQSKEMLIHKKRVLRSVSVNPIVSKNYGEANRLSLDTLGILAGTYNDDLDEDAYGFLKHQDKFTQRIFSNGLQAYLGEVDVDEVDDFGSEDREVRKHKSQVLSRCGMESSSEECDDEVSDASSSEDEVGMLKQIQYLILGPAAKKTKKKEAKLVDDSLRFKFLTITIGIIVVGLKLSHQNHQA